MRMTKNEKKMACLDFFKQLAKELKEYEIIGSCNNDDSMYLIPNGTSDQISYYGKPALSFRISDHWNWLSNTKKCSDRYHVQCHSVDMPRNRCRMHDDEKATKPRYGWQIAFYDTDGLYHHVFGEKFDRWNHEWTWECSSIEDVLLLVRG